ncbi:MAG TPA: hypothetical protein VLA92_02205 [Candidatus Saccharimonadales bacterium]|nr:hypothetical protein [Candidatus Saccharimonadales bacterium]
MAEQVSPPLWELLEDYPDANLSRGVSFYLAAQSPEHQRQLGNGLDYLIDHSTESFEDAGVADMGTAVVISRQEAGNIVHALSQYEPLEDEPSERIVGYLNWPEPHERDSAQEVRELLDDFIQHNPDVPFGYFEGQEHVPICMGQVRKMPADALQPLIKDNALMSSHDADLRFLSPGFRSEMYRNYRERGLKVVVPHVFHEPVAGKPNLNQLLSWYDDPELQSMQDRCYDLGVAFSADEYRMAGGYGPDYMSESMAIAGTIAATHAISLPSDGLVPEARLGTSPRRIVSKLLAGMTLNDVWQGPGDFRANEAYRKLSEDDIDKLPDISDEHRDTCLRAYASQILGLVAAKHEFIEDGTADRIDLIFQLEAIQARLGGPANMFDFDNWRP